MQGNIYVKDKIYYTTPDGSGIWVRPIITKYDERGNKISYKGYSIEEDYIYDNKGNLIHVQLPDDEEIWMDYDSNGNCIHFKDSRSYHDDYWYEYDNDNKLIHLKVTHYIKDSSYERWYEYDENGNCIHERGEGTIILKYWQTIDEIWYEYDDNGNLIYIKNNKAYLIYLDYDSNGKCTHIKYYRDFPFSINEPKINYYGKLGFTNYCKYNEVWKNYNDEGNCICEKRSNGQTIWFEYNNENKCIYKYDSFGNKSWYEYDYYSKGLICRKIKYKRLL